MELRRYVFIQFTVMFSISSVAGLETQLFLCFGLGGEWGGRCQLRNSTIVILF